MLLLYMNFMGAAYVVLTVMYSIVSQKKKYLKVLIGGYIGILLAVYSVGIMTNTARLSVLITQLCCLISLALIGHKNKDL